MSELVSDNKDKNDFRKHLLATASLLAFTSFAASSAVQASDGEHPTAWIELGGQMEFTHGTSSPFVTPFMINQADTGAFSPVSPLEAQKAPRFSLGEEGKITIQPKDSNWVFSAALRYGRSGSKRYIHQQTRGFPIPTTSPMFHGTTLLGDPPQHYMSGELSYAEYRERQSESHLVLDFKAGKDVGVGMFGNDSTSVFSVGIRLARLSSGETSTMNVRPDVHGTDFRGVIKYNAFFHQYSLTGYRERSFSGIGPSVSWEGSAPVFGNPDAGELAFDWSANGALLFGKQKMRGHHKTTGFYRSGYSGFGSRIRSAYSNAKNPTRSRSVVVPNIGGSFAVAYRFENAKLDIGYRADFYLNAMDTGMDTRQTSNVLFHGPFASVSIGLGG